MLNEITCPSRELDSPRKLNFNLISLITFKLFLKIILHQKYYLLTFFSYGICSIEGTGRNDFFNLSIADTQSYIKVIQYLYILCLPQV